MGGLILFEEWRGKGLERGDGEGREQKEGSEGELWLVLNPSSLLPLPSLHFFSTKTCNPDLSGYIGHKTRFMNYFCVSMANIPKKQHIKDLVCLTIQGVPIHSLWFC